MTQIKLIIAGVLLLMFLGGAWYIRDLKRDNKDLREDNKILVANVEAANRQVLALAERDVKNQKISAEYERLKRELKGKQNGPVADVLRFAIDSDVVQ